MTLAHKAYDISSHAKIKKISQNKATLGDFSPKWHPPKPVYIVNIVMDGVAHVLCTVHASPFSKVTKATFRLRYGRNARWDWEEQLRC